MAYSTSTPPVLVSSGIAGKGNVFEYKSTDAATAVDASGYITNGVELGMTVGDQVNVHDTDATPYTVSIHFVVSAASNGSVDLCDAAATGGTDTD